MSTSINEEQQYISFNSTGSNNSSANLPSMSNDKYMTTYENFLQWKKCCGPGVECILLDKTADIQTTPRIVFIVPRNFWRTVREDYTKATSLVRQVDEMISGIVLVSFGSNVFSICFLFLHVLEDGLKPSVICNVPSDRRLLSGYEYTIYYLFSICFLLIRSLTMSLIAARVNTTSAETAFALYDVPSDAFNDEVQRLIDQIHGDSVALSGLNFFSVKRGIVLTIAGAIVTYELVILQFSGIDPAPSIKS